MITCGYRNCSFILPLQDTPFSTMVLLRQIYKLRRYLTVPLHRTFSFFSAIALWSLVTEFRCDFFIMSRDDFWHIVHATIADCNCIVIEYFMKFAASRKCFVTNLRNVFSTFIETDLLKGGLNHIMFCFCVFGFSDLLSEYFKSIL